MKKKYYKTPVLITGENVRGFIPAAIAAATGAVAATTAAAASTVAASTLVAYAVGRAVKAVAEYHPNDPTIPNLIKVYD